MEDFLLIEEELNLSKTHLSSVFCIIDGHGGWECARFVQQNLAKYLRQSFADATGSVSSAAKVDTTLETAHHVDLFVE